MPHPQHLTIAHVADDLSIELTDEFSLQGGTVLVGTGVQEWDEADAEGRPFASKLSIATWEGAEFSLHTHGYEMEAQHLLGVLDSFVIEEADHGIVIGPKDATSTTESVEPSVLQEVSGSGLAQIRPLTAERTSGLPSHAGTAVAGGELYSARDADIQSFVLVGGSSVTTFMPSDDCHDESLLVTLDSLSVEWTRPARVIRGRRP